MKALIIIDIQKALFIKKTSIYKEKDLIDNTNLLLCRAERQNAAIVIVRHCNDTFLREGSPDWQLHDSLQLPEPVIFINKHHGSCFQDTNLNQELRTRNIQAVVIAGLVTNGCIRASSLEAIKLGYDVTLVSDGHSSYAKDAAASISTWNDRIKEAGANLQKATEVSFD